MKTIRVLSLGAGVQSTAIALMIKDGKLPPIDAAVFADTQEEPQAVYSHLQWLMRETQSAFPTLVRTHGKLGEHLKTGTDGQGGRFAAIPAFTKDPLNPEEKEGMTRRQCTSEYKINVIQKAIRREILGLKPRQRMPKDVEIVQLMGLSADEGGRVARTRLRMIRQGFATPNFPLWDQLITRSNCQMTLKGCVPHETPRSACVFCPYHKNREWQNIKANAADWARACEIDDALRVPGNVVNRGMDKQLFVHRSCVPLREADLTAPDPQPVQMGLAFEAECTGLCGV